MVCLVQRHESTMKSPSGSETLRSSRRIKELLMMKAVSSPAEVTSVPTGIHNNKENQDATHPPHHNTSQDTLPSNGLEDSGYLSLHNSQLSDHYDNETDHVQGQPPDIPSPPATTYKSSPSSPNRHASPSSSTPRVSRGTTSLPIVRFQQAVCAELARSFQKNQRYDWSIVSLLAEEHLLDRVIGGQMGRDHVDVFSALLSRNLRGILCRILALLGDLDLISCRTVSRTWQKIILEDSTAMGRIQRAGQQMDSNSPVSQVVPGSGLTRDSGLPRVVLSSLQTLASTSSSSSPASRSSPVPLEPTPSSNQMRFNTFLQVASRLKQHECLWKCRRCCSPARHNAQTQRATCTRSSCQFDFCTHCQEAFHGALPCRTVQPARTSTPAATRSKRALRRL